MHCVVRTASPYKKWKFWYAVIFQAACGMLPFGWWGAKKISVAIIFYAVYLATQFTISRIVFTKDPTAFVRQLALMGSTLVVILIYFAFFAAFCAQNLPGRP